MNLESGTGNPLPKHVLEELREKFLFFEEELTTARRDRERIGSKC